MAEERELTYPVKNGALDYAKHGLPDAVEEESFYKLAKSMLTEAWFAEEPEKQVPFFNFLVGLFFDGKFELAKKALVEKDWCTGAASAADHGLEPLLAILHCGSYDDVIPDPEKKKKESGLYAEMIVSLCSDPIIGRNSLLLFLSALKIYYEAELLAKREQKRELDPVFFQTVFEQALLAPLGTNQQFSTDHCWMALYILRGSVYCFESILTVLYQSNLTFPLYNESQEPLEFFCRLKHPRLIALALLRTPATSALVIGDKNLLPVWSETNSNPKWLEDEVDVMFKKFREDPAVGHSLAIDMVATCTAKLYNLLHQKYNIKPLKSRNLF